MADSSDDSSVRNGTTTADSDILDRFLMNSYSYNATYVDSDQSRTHSYEHMNTESPITSNNSNHVNTANNPTASNSMTMNYRPKMDVKPYDKGFKFNAPQYTQLQDYHHHPREGSTGGSPMTIDGATKYEHNFGGGSNSVYTEAPSTSQTTFMPPPFGAALNYHNSYVHPPQGGATNFRRDHYSSRKGTSRFDAKYPQLPLTSIASVGRLPTVKEDFASDWLADIPSIGSMPRFSQENISDVIQAGNYDSELAEQVVKIEQISPTQANRFSFSRTSSTGSIHAVCGSSASSTHNTGDVVVIASPETTEVTDDEDSDTTRPPNLKERRREAHTQAEQKRRDAIKKGYDDLQMLVPTCQQADPVGSTKLSKAAVLQRSIDYMQYLLQQKKKQEDDLESLRKEVTALKIMKANYEHIVKAHKSTPAHGQNQVSDEVKFQVYQQLMDSLFQSFNGSISVNNFAELSGSVFRWLEEYCKPQALRSQTDAILRKELANMQQ